MCWFEFHTDFLGVCKPSLKRSLIDFIFYLGQPGVDSPTKGGLGEEPIVYSYEAVTQQEVRYTRPVIVLGEWCYAYNKKGHFIIL